MIKCSFSNIRIVSLAGEIAQYIIAFGLLEYLTVPSNQTWAIHNQL